VGGGGGETQGAPPGGVWEGGGGEGGGGEAGGGGEGHTHVLASAGYLKEREEEGK